MAAAAAVARFAGVSRKGSLTPCHRLRGRPGSCSSWRARAAEEGRASPSENGVASGRPLVAILWDLDNVSPGVDPERARITARRLRDAASRLGGGALGGASAASGEDVAGPADIVAFLGFANDATLARVSARALREEGVDVRRAESTPDAADMDLGAHVLRIRARVGGERARRRGRLGTAAVCHAARARRARGAARAEAVSALGAAGITHRSNDAAANPSPRRPSRAPPRKPSAPLSSISPRRPSRGTTPSQTRSLRRRRSSSSRRTTTSCPPFPSRGENAGSRGGVRRLPPEGAAGGRRRAGEQAETRARRGVFRVRD